MPSNLNPRTSGLACMTGVALLLAACGGGEAPQPAPSPTEVSVVRVEASAMAIADELPGRVAAYRVADIRPQVGGIIQRRLFEQGSEVRAGQPLFQINAAPFQADAATASAGLQRAQAVLARARVQQKRLEPLVEADAISGQSYDDAEAARVQAAADVAQNRATLQRRRLDVGFATVRSPISGRIDQAVLTEGALATVGDANPLATVQQIDRVFVDVRQPAARLMPCGQRPERAPATRAPRSRSSQRTERRTPRGGGCSSRASASTPGPARSSPASKWTTPIDRCCRACSSGHVCRARSRGTR